MDSGPLIAIFCNSFPPEGGGASARIYNLATLLRDAGYRVQVVAAMPNYPTGRIFSAYRGKLVVDEEVDGISVRRVWLSPSNAASALARGWSIASFVLSLKLLAFRHVRKMQPALVIVSSPPLPMAAATARYFKKRHYKVLLNVSDLWPLSANALGALNRSNLYSQLEAVASRMYRAVDAITAQSNETLKHIRNHCTPMPPAMLYRNLPAPSSAHSDQSNTVADRARIIYPGLLGHAQGILALCRAIDFSLLGAELHIYGEGPELAAIQSFVSDHPGRNIHLHKSVPADTLASLLENYEAMLIPLISPIEGALPSKLFTAMQSGVPVLYSGGGEGAAIVAAYELGWTASPGDYSAIAHLISELAAMTPEAITLLREHIRTVADSYFNKQIQDDELLQFVAAVIG